MLRHSLFLSMLLSVTMVYSQDNRKKEFQFVSDSLSFYARAVVNFANMKGTINQSSFETTLGYAVGFYGEYKINAKTGITAGLEWSTRGAGIKDDNASGSLSYRLSYVELPIGISYYPLKRVKLMGAIVPAVKVGESLAAYYMAVLPASGARLIDLGVSGGVQFVPRIANSDKYVLTTGYTFGLTQIARKDAGFRANNRTFYIGVAYRIS